MQQLTRHGSKMSAYSWLVSFAAAIGGFLYGYELGVVSQVLAMDSFGLYFGKKALLNGIVVVPDVKVAADFDGNVTTTFLIGCVVGTLLVSSLADGIGRKWSISVASGLFCIGGVLQFMCTELVMLYVGRVISGIGIGISCAVVPLYISETAETKVRGRMVTIQQLMITFGVFFASCVNALILSWFTGDLEWRLAMGMQIVPGLCLLLIMLAMPHSPRWLINRDRNDEALIILARLRGTSSSSKVLLEEFNDIKDSILSQRLIGNASWSEILRPGIINRVFLGGLLQFFHQWTGINVILYYQTELFTRLGFSASDAAIPFTIANNFINFVATIPGMYLIERLGRRKLLVYGGFGICLSHIMICVFYGLSTQNQSLAWGAVLGIYSFFFFFAVSWGPITWVYSSEIFPLRVRAKGSSISTLSAFTWNAILAKIVPIIEAQIGFYTYLIFACTCLIMALFAVFFVPETMGLSLQDMDGLFGTRFLTRYRPSPPPMLESSSKVTAQL